MMSKVMKTNQSKIDDLEDDEDDVEGTAIDDAVEVQGNASERSMILRIKRAIQRSPRVLISRMRRAM